MIICEAGCTPLSLAGCLVPLSPECLASIAACHSACAATAVPLLAGCQVESCFTSIYDEEDWIFSFLHNLDIDADSFINGSEQSLAKNQGASPSENTTFNDNKNQFSGSWEEPWWDSSW